MRCEQGRQRSSVTLHHLGSFEPKRSQARRLHPFGELSAEAEVSKLCDHRLQACSDQQDVTAFDVPVDDTDTWPDKR